MQLTDEQHGNVTVITAAGRLDGAGAPEIEAHGMALIKNGTVRLVLDMAAVEYISSAGLRSLLVIAKAVKAAGGAWVLCNLTPMVREVMAISCFDKILTLAADRDAALKGLAAA